jgi:hypothetical protein
VYVSLLSDTGSAFTVKMLFTSMLAADTEVAAAKHDKSIITLRNKDNDFLNIKASFIKVIPFFFGVFLVFM